MRPVTSPADPLSRTPAAKPRARGLGIPFGGEPGRWNALTDVPGIEVGMVTRIPRDRVVALLKERGVVE
jgi:D-aminopeptidase